MRTAVGKKHFCTTQWMVRIMCALALVLVGFAHQPPISDADELTPAKLVQYRLPDGTLPILCVTYKGTDGKEHSKTHAPGCEACRIATAVLLPAPPTDVCERLASSDQDVLAPRAEAFHRQLYPPNTGPRAPPILQITA
ncbi:MULTISPECIES: hypothetical protein [unclassified Rhizobium]|uniref:hypothetical protein n=1 Tax=unclassified Rhizobium TaxID=2613769 RepID=UPI000CDF4531|nr:MULTISPECIES: hypothetical protein [Rhizobium]AVA25534.1 hypothetical protein NXC24_PC01093 [Rhizobium sp. NXC24]UWU25282.1 hypothetical protein N2601_24440 [Rhizobium tropici]